MAVAAYAPAGVRGVSSAVAYFSLGALWQWDRHRAAAPVSYDTGVEPLKAEERGQKIPVPELSEAKAADEPAAAERETPAAEQPAPVTGGSWLTAEEVAYWLTGLHLAWWAASWTCRRRNTRTARGVVRRYVVPVDADAAGVADRRTLRRRSRVA